MSLAGPITARRASRLWAPRPIAFGLAAPRSIGARRPIAPWAIALAAGRPIAQRAALRLATSRLPAFLRFAFFLAQAVEMLLTLGAKLTFVAPSFLLVESRPRILVIATGTPVTVALLRLATVAVFLALEFSVLLLARVPEPSAGEPLHLRVRVRALELIQRWQELVCFARAKRGRGAVDQDRPVCEAGRHRPIIAVRRDPDASAFQRASCASG